MPAAASSCAAASIGAAGAAAATVIGTGAQAQTRRRWRCVDYPSNRLANLADLKLNEPLDIAYPDADSPGVLLKLGTPVAGRRRARMATSSPFRCSARTRACRSATTPTTRR